MSDVPATISQEAHDIARAVASVNRSQIEAIQQIGQTIDNYVLRRTYADIGKATDPGRIRTEAIKALQDEVNHITETTVDLHRTYQIYGAMCVYRTPITQYTPSVWKELATTCRYNRDAGAWEPKDGIEIATITDKLGNNPTVTQTRTLIGGLLPKRAIRHVAKVSEQVASPAPPVVPPPPVVNVVTLGGAEFIVRRREEPVCRVAEKFNRGESEVKAPAVEQEPEPAPQPVPEPPPDKPAKGLALLPAMKHALGLQSKAREVLDIVRFNDGEDTPRPVGDQADIWGWLAKELADDEITALVQGLSKFDSSWDTLRQACKTENDRRRQKDSDS